MGAIHVHSDIVALRDLNELLNKCEFNSLVPFVCALVATFTHGRDLQW